MSPLVVESQMHDGVRPLKVPAIRLAVGIPQIGNGNTLNQGTVPRRVSGVKQHKIIPLAKRG